MQSLLENKKIVVGEHYVTMFGTQKISTGAQVLGMLSPLFLTISLVLIMVGIGLPYWLIYGGTSYGIFQICASSVTSCSFSITELGTSHPDSKYDTKRVFSLLMRIFTLLIMISTNHVCKFSFVGVLHWNIMISMAVIGGFFLFISEILIFIYPCKKEINHCKLGLGAVSCFFCFVGGIH